MNFRSIVLLVAGGVALAGCATTSPGVGYRGGAQPSRYPPASTSRACADCGIVTRIDTIASNRSAPTGTGAVLGGIVGAVAGRQISEQTGGSKGNKNVATVAGAAGGALAGNAIQNRVTSDSYDITVRMDDGHTVVINQRDLAGVRENTYVRIVNGRVVVR